MGLGMFFIQAFLRDIGDEYLLRDDNCLALPDPEERGSLDSTPLKGSSEYEV